MLTPKPWECIVAGSVSGCAGVIVCHPIDVVRTHIQTSSSYRSNSSSSTTAIRGTRDGALPTFRSLWHTQGMKGFYRGITGPLVAQALYKSLIFTTNSTVHSALSRRRSSRSKTSLLFLSGFIAGSVNAFLVAPIEMIRTHQILSDKSFYTSFRSFALGHNNTSGSSSNLRFLLWRGLLPTILRDGPGIGLYFLTFESTKVLFLNYYNNTIGTHQPMEHAQQQQQQNQPLWCRLLAGSLAGIAFWVWALPIDTIKANIEASSSSYITNLSSPQRPCIRTIVDGEGIRYLLRAWPVALGRGIPSAAVTLTTYDIISQYLVQHRIDGT
jgi:hypothetical protein